MANINKIRKILVDMIKVADYHSIKIKDLGFDDEFIEYLLFDVNKNNKKNFAKKIVKVLDKIDFSGVSFDNFYCESYDFSNLYGVCINPQTILHKSLIDVKLCDVEFIGPFDDVNICRADFTGSKGAKIDPQKVSGKDFYKTILTDAEIIGSFEGIRIKEKQLIGTNCDSLNSKLYGDLVIKRTNYQEDEFKNKILKLTNRNYMPKK